MKVSVLIKVLEGMYHHCRHRTLSLTFYDSPFPAPSRRPDSRKEFDNNLPDIYYVASISANSKILYVMQRSERADRAEDIIISTDKNFDFSELERSGNKYYTVHEYRDSSPFSKNPNVLNDSGEYKTYVECLKYDATLYIDLFKLMGGTVSLVIESKDQLYLGHYLDGKILIVEVNNLSVNIKVADFYSLQRYLPEYELLDFIPYPQNIGRAAYFRKLRHACNEGGLQFIED